MISNDNIFLVDELFIVLVRHERRIPDAADMGSSETKLSLASLVHVDALRECRTMITKDIRVTMLGWSFLL